jgi:benzoyl-CoA reductase subunit D
MITSGIDAGARMFKAVVVKDGRIIGRAIQVIDTDTETSANAVYEAALKEAGVTRDDVDRIIATGAGRKLVSFAPNRLTEVTAAARGAYALYPGARTVIDIGAEEGRVVKIGEDGRVVDFAVNEKCAAGAGVFIEAMARALETTVEELGPLSLKSTGRVKLNAQCAVFAESEVVSLVHAKTPPEDIARAVHDAISGKIAAMVRRVGIDRDIVLTGGVSKNVGFVESLKHDLESEILIPDEPEFVGAYGAALAAAGKSPG